MAEPFNVGDRAVRKLKTTYPLHRRWNSLGVQGTLETRKHTVQWSGWQNNSAHGLNEG